MPLEGLVFFWVFGMIVFGITLGGGCVCKITAAKIVGVAGIGLVLLTIMWAACSTEQRIIDKGTYAVQELQGNDGAVIQCIASDGGTKIVDLYGKFRRSIPKGSKVKVTAYGPYRNGINWMNGDMRFYELIPPKGKDQP